jgi:hypothetical protein
MGAARLLTMDEGVGRGPVSALESDLPGRIQARSLAAGPEPRVVGTVLVYVVRHRDMQLSVGVLLHWPDQQSARSCAG